ncbi:hypothetical protein R1flu_015753 [Riccia fluitans]|uniref:Acyltransferase 3 domain-containing protein n=1 Tax=Riccia fluitans TaxID=41844 RepID=A0ABD1YJY5_9MARC
MGSRRNDIDWLRTLASYLVLIYHAAQFFDYQKKTYFKNAELSEALDYFTRFVHLWHMPLFFLLAGWSSNSSLNSRGTRGFLSERVQRLFVPLTFGMTLLCAPPKWVEFRNGLWKTTSAGEQITKSGSVSFITFLQEYYYPEGITWGHLWFLIYLFTFSLLYLPLLWLLSKSSFSESALYKWAKVVTNAPVVLLACVQLGLRDRWPGYQNLVDDWANFWFYSTFFIAGFCLAQFAIIEDHLLFRCKRNGILGFSACLIYIIRHRLSELDSKPDSVQHILSAVGAWYVVCFLLPLARQTLADTPAPAFWANNAFPVYVIHDVPLCLVAEFELRRWDSSVGKKFVYSGVAALLSSFFFLFVIARRVWLFRVLLGMKSSSPVPTKYHPKSQ